MDRQRREREEEIYSYSTSRVYDLKSLKNQSYVVYSLDGKYDRGTKNWTTKICHIVVLHIGIRSCAVQYNNSSISMDCVIFFLVFHTYIYAWLLYRMTLPLCWQEKNYLLFTGLGPLTMFGTTTSPPCPCQPTSWPLLSVTLDMKFHLQQGTTSGRFVINFIHPSILEFEGGGGLGCGRVKL